MGVSKNGIVCSKCHMFCSKRGILMDAYLTLWAPNLMYAFQPTPVIPKVLRKLRQDGCMIMIVPEWTRSNESNNSEISLVSQNDGPKSLHLAAWRLAGRHQQREAALLYPKIPFFNAESLQPGGPFNHTRPNVRSFLCEQFSISSQR